jgi:hypothetical protein
VEGCTEYSSFCHSRTECAICVDIFGFVIWSEVRKKFEDLSNVISILDAFKLIGKDEE